MSTGVLATRLAPRLARPLTTKPSTELIKELAEFYLSIFTFLAPVNARYHVI